LRCDCPDFKGHANRYRYPCKHLCFLIVIVEKIHADHRTFVERRLRGKSLAAVASKLRILAIGLASVDPELVDHDLSSRYAASAAREKRMDDEFASVLLNDDTTVSRGETVNDARTARRTFTASVQSAGLRGKKTCPLCRSQAWRRSESSALLSGQYMQL
jgi:hypothetical protein